MSKDHSLPEITAALLSDLADDADLGKVVLNTAAWNRIADALERVGALLPPHGEPRYDKRGRFAGMTTGSPAWHSPINPTLAWLVGDIFECTPTEPCWKCEPPVPARALREALNPKETP